MAWLIKKFKNPIKHTQKVNHQPSISFTSTLVQQTLMPPPPAAAATTNNNTINSRH
jgi:hypothetical protein